MTRIVGKQEYFEEALDVLANDGFKGLNIGRLCKTLGVTSGSFYHHFGGWQGFVDALMQFWENRQVLQLKDLALGTGGPQADLEVLRKVTLGLHHEAEAAIRAWGGNDEGVRAVRHRVDDARRKTVFKAIRGVVGDGKVAGVLTALGMAMLVGYQQLSTDDDHAELESLLDEYFRLIRSHADGA